MVVSLLDLRPELLEPQLLERLEPLNAVADSILRQLQGRKDLESEIRRAAVVSDYYPGIMPLSIVSGFYSPRADRERTGS
jgi:hypothetical protein